MKKEDVYYFMLMKQSEKKVIDYSYLFGNNYNKLCFLYSFNNKRKFINIFKDNANIIIPKKFNNLSEIKLEELNVDFSVNPTSKGIIIYLDDDNNRTIKLQNFKYQFYTGIGPLKHIFNGYIVLYQKDKLQSFFNNNKNHLKYKTITNPYNSNEIYDIIDCIHCLFINISNELFNIFHHFYNKKKNKDYNRLPLEYKKIIEYAKLNNFNTIYFLLKYI